MNNKRILLIEPLNERFFQRGTLRPPHNKLGLYALEKLAGELETRGYKTKTICLRKLTIEQLVDIAEAFQPFLIGFSVLTFNFNLTKKLAEALKVRMPSVKIVLGGYHINEVPSDITSSEAFNVAALGYGEKTICHLADFYSGKGKINSLDEIEGLVIPDPNSNGFRRTKPQTLSPVDTTAWAKRNWPAIREARCTFMAHPAPDNQIGGVAQISTANGCIFQCTFCGTPALESAGYGLSNGRNRVSYRDPVDVAQELLMLRDKGVKIGFVTTATINDRPDRLRSLCEAIINVETHSRLPEDHPRHVLESIHLHAYCKVGLSDELALLMYQAGFSVIATGVESGEVEIVSGWNKPYNPNDFNVVVNHMRAWDRVGGLNRALLIFPTPLDSPRTRDRLIERLKIALPDCIRMSHITPGFGTPDGQQLRSAGLVTSNDYDLYDHNHQLVQLPHFTPDEASASQMDVYVGYHMSTEYRDHVVQKLIRCPWLKPTFRHSFQILEQHSRGRIQLLHLVGT